ncbi:hemolysin family protein [[Mycoplasma] gypis]|uniref:Hemolysin family protein n=1 Tax=[Mycoplasma] gypis TaxID=92404 RepID=A0ABZ2RN57_9BACT|nr:hemolysin family protein [[Mycoplasma] gypis]MBN0919601.1 HlyC/CorC family transporter [[Mycoplasma] gypis]
MSEGSQSLITNLDLNSSVQNNAFPDTVVQIILFTVLLILLILSAIISGSETAYTSLSLAKINNLVEKKVRGAKLILKHHSRFNQTLSTILLFNNMVNIASSTLTAYILGIWLSNNSNIIPIISTLVLTPVLVIFGEILPKIVAKNHPIGYLRIFVYFIHFLYIISYPFTFFISKIGKKVLVTNSEEELKSIIDIASDEGVLETNESMLTQKALDLDSTKVSSHYIRLNEVITIKASASINQALEIFDEYQYSRLPIVKNNELIGIVHLKDIFNKKTGKVINYLKTVPNISMNISLSSALEKMRLNRAQMAFVTKNNSSNKVLGIITIEDILEELVGEIYDEYDDEEDVFEISLQRSRAKSSINLKTLFKQLEIDTENISEEELQLSLEKWLEQKLGHNLHKNDRFEWDEYVSFKVLETKKGKLPAIIEVNIL